MMLFNPKGKITYQLFEHTNESSFEKVVVSLASEIFGEESIYIDVKKKNGLKVVKS